MYIILFLLVLVSFFLLFYISKQFRVFIGICFIGLVLLIGILKVIYDRVNYAEQNTTKYTDQIINHISNNEYGYALDCIESFNTNNKEYKYIKQLRETIYKNILTNNEWKIEVVPDIRSKYLINNYIYLTFDKNNNFHISDNNKNIILGNYELIEFNKYIDEEFINNGGSNNSNNKIPFRLANNDNIEEKTSKILYIKLNYETQNLNIINDKYLSYWDCVCKELYKNRYYKFKDDMYPLNSKLDEPFYKENNSQSRFSWLVPQNDYNSFNVKNEIWWNSYVK